MAFMLLLLDSHPPNLSKNFYSTSPSGREHHSPKVYGAASARSLRASPPGRAHHKDAFSGGQVQSTHPGRRKLCSLTSCRGRPPRAFAALVSHLRGYTASAKYSSCPPLKASFRINRNHLIEKSFFTVVDISMQI